MNVKEVKNTTVNYFFASEFSESEEEKTNDNGKSPCLSNFNIPDYNQLVQMEQ